MPTTKIFSSPVRMDEETKNLLRDRSKVHGLSESGYIRMLIRQESGLSMDDKPHRSPVDLFRDVFNRLPWEDDPKSVGMDRDSPPDTYIKRISQAIDTLDERENQIIRDRYFEGLTYSDIGKRIGRSAPRVSQIIWRAVRRLKHPSRTKIILGK